MTNSSYLLRAAVVSLVAASMALCLIVIDAAAESPQIRVATVDVNAVLNSLPESKNRKKELDAVSQKARSTIEKKRNELKKLEDKVKDKNLPQGTEELENLRREAREYERLVQDTEQELKRKLAQANQELAKKAMAAIEKYVQANNIDLVLEKSRSALGPVLFGSSAIDITDKVVANVK